jgi:hypothetical protein
MTETVFTCEHCGDGLATETLETTGEKVCPDCLEFLDPERPRSWGEMADLNHTNQVRIFGWCACEDETAPYDDCPKKKKEKDYTLNAYADGFGVWHCEINFNYPGLGNTGEAERVAGNGLRAAKRLIRAEIADRMAGRVKRLSYYVKSNKTQPGSGRLLSLTIAEK